MRSDQDSQCSRYCVDHAIPYVLCAIIIYIFGILICLDPSVRGNDRVGSITALGAWRCQSFSKLVDRVGGNDRV